MAVDTLAHVGPPQRRALWSEPRWLGCSLDTAPAPVRARFAVYRAVAERDARAMLARARAELERLPPGADPGWARFLLLTAALGAQASGEGSEARRLWRVYAPALLAGGAKPYERYIAEWQN